MCKFLSAYRYCETSLNLRIKCTYSYRTDILRRVEVEVGSGLSVTYAELMHKSELVAARLLRQGCRYNDVIALFAPNSIDWVVVCLAALRIGATVAAVNSLLTAGVITLHHNSYLVYASYQKKLSTGVLQSSILTIYSTNSLYQL